MKDVKSILVKKIVDTDRGSLNAIFSEKGKVYSFLNPVSYLTALDNLDSFSRLDGLFADGSLLVKAIKIMYGETITRKSFDETSLAPSLFSYANDNGCKVCVIASHQEEVEASIKKLSSKYSSICWNGSRNGYFSSIDDMTHAAEQVSRENPDYLIVGMGSGIQEKFLLMCKDKGFSGIGFSCGGFIHQLAMNDSTYYPEWIDQYNLRFIYRFVKEKHTRKRYILSAFIFPYRFIKEKFSNR